MEATIDIRKLQILNDRINQTLEALEALRQSVHSVSVPTNSHSLAMAQRPSFMPNQFGQVGMVPNAPGPQMGQYGLQNPAFAMNAQGPRQATIGGGVNPVGFGLQPNTPQSRLGWGVPGQQLEQLSQPWIGGAVGQQFPHTQGLQGQFPQTRGFQGQFPQMQGLQGQFPQTQGWQGQIPNTQGLQGQFPHTQGLQNQFGGVQPMSNQVPRTSVGSLGTRSFGGGIDQKPSETNGDTGYGAGLGWASASRDIDIARLTQTFPNVFSPVRPVM